MLNSRPKYQDIEFVHFGSPSMQIGTSIKDGDDVTLKYKQFSLEVERITIITEDQFSGAVSSILKTDSEDELSELGEPLNIRVGDTIEFSEKNIFNCTRS